MNVETLWLIFWLCLAVWVMIGIAVSVGAIIVDPPKHENKYFVVIAAIFATIVITIVWPLLIITKLTIKLLR